MRSWRRRDRLERELLRSRPRPRDEFVRSLAKRAARHERRPRVFGRAALVAAVTALVVVAVATAGGFNQGGTALVHVLTFDVPHPKTMKVLSLKSINVVKGDDRRRDDDPSRDQYEEQRKACQRTEDARHDAAEDSLDRRRHQAEADLRACQRRIEATHEQNLDALDAQHDAALAHCARGGAGAACRQAANTAYSNAIKSENASYQAARQDCRDQYQATIAQIDADRRAEQTLHRQNQQQCQQIGRP